MALVRDLMHSTMQTVRSKVFSALTLSAQPRCCVSVVFARQLWDLLCIKMVENGFVLGPNFHSTSSVDVAHTLLGEVNLYKSFVGKGVGNVSHVEAHITVFCPLKVWYEKGMLCVSFSVQSWNRFNVASNAFPGEAPALQTASLFYDIEPIYEDID